MRWSIIRLIWLRELRDQLRDRRTVIMMAVLPLLLYPALGFGVLQFALSFANKPNVVGIYGAENLAPLPQQASIHFTPDRVAKTVASMGPNGDVYHVGLTALVPNLSTQDYQERVSEFCAWTA